MEAKEGMEEEGRGRNGRRRETMERMGEEGRLRKVRSRKGRRKMKGD